MPLIQRERQNYAGVLALTLLLQLFLVSWTFPVRELLTQTPLFHIDGAYHWLQMHVARDLAEQGRLTGYDPYFAAGNVGGVTLNASAKVPSLLFFLLGGYLSAEQTYKLFVFVASVLGPAMVPLAARIAKADSRATWVAAGLALCAWWATAFRWYHTAGMVSFVLACFLALPFSVLVVRCVLSDAARATHVVCVGLSGAAGFFLHPLFPVPVALLTTSLLAAEWRTIAWQRAIVVLVAIGAISLGPNLPWILAMLRSESTVASVLVYQTRVDITTIPKEAIGLWRGESMGAKLYSGLLVAAIAAAAGALAPADRRFARASLAAWAVLALFAAVGAAVPGFANIQPNRFSAAAYLFLLIPAATGVEALYRWVRSSSRAKRAVALGMTTVCTASFAWSSVEVAREVSYAPVGHYGAPPPEVNKLGEKSAWLVQWLATNTSADGRILFETSKARIHDGAHMAGYYAIKSEREFIGGPYPYMFTTSFWDGVAFGRPIASIASGEFARYLDLYNIGWIVVHSEESKRYLASAPDVVQEATHDDLAIFRVNRSLSFFLAGSGRVEQRDENRVVLSDLEGEEVVVKYHYISGLTSDPPVTIEPFSVAGVPRPFVRLSTNGTRRVVLSLR